MITSSIALWGVIAGVTALAFWLDRRVPALSKIGTTLMAIIFGAILCNADVVPASSPVYDGITGPVTSLAIAWLLVSVNLADLRRVGGPMLAAFGLAAAGTVAGSLVATLLFGSGFGDQAWRLAGAVTGTYSGGSINFVGVGRALELDDVLFAGAVAADNLTTGIWVGATLVLPVWLRRFFPWSASHGSADTAEMEEAHPFFAPSPLSADSLALLLALGLGLVLAAERVALLVPVAPSVLWLTTFALLAGQIPAVARLAGARVLGYLGLNLFFVVIGIHSRLAEIFRAGVSVFGFTLVVVLIHGLVVYGVGRLLRMDVAVLSVASQAAVGGPSSAVAVAAGRGWPALVLPGVGVGLVGYALGNYLGFAVAGLVRLLG